MQHDVQELNRVLCEKLEEKMKVRKGSEAGGGWAGDAWGIQACCF